MLLGCGPGAPSYSPKDYDPDLTKIARASQVQPIIDALAAYHKANGSYPKQGTAIAELAPYCPPGVTLALNSYAPGSFVNGWDYMEAAYGATTVGGYHLLHQINHWQGLLYNFDGTKGTWNFTREDEAPIPILLSP